MLLGEKLCGFKCHRAVSFADLVPAGTFYCQLEVKLDLSVRRDLAQDRYAMSMGRPLIDPVVFIKLQLFICFGGFRSER